MSLEEDTHFSRAETGSADAGGSEFKELLRKSGEAMLEFFLGDQLEHAVPDIHIDIWNRLINLNQERTTLAIPRGHAKTTLAKLAVVWYYLFSNYRFCTYLSNTNAVAKNACRDIIQFMKHRNFEALFGPIEMIKENETESIWIFNIIMWNGRKKRCILRAVGTGQQIRGLNVDNERPDIVIADDVEDRENTGTIPQQKALDQWVFGTFIKALAARTKLVWIGNMLSQTSLLARLVQRPNWNAVVFGCLVTDDSGAIRPLWPDLWPLEKIVADFHEYSDLGLSETWMCEMMNMPGYGKNGFKLDSLHFQPLPTPDDLVGAFVTIDPAFGQDAILHDKSAVVVHGIPTNGCPMVLGYAHTNLDETQLFETALVFAYIWNAWVWGIESVAAQKVLQNYFKLLAATRGLQGRIEVVELHAARGDPKFARITACVSLMAAKEYALYEGDVEAVSQFLVYDRAKKKQPDDLIDSIAYGPQMLERYMGLITESFAREGNRDPVKPSFGLELTRV